MPEGEGTGFSKMKVDVHCHLDFKDFDKDRDEVIKRAEQNGFSAIIANGLDVKTNRNVIKLAKKYKIVKPALGMYPTHGLELTEKELDEELKFIEKQKPSAIGEIGLDLFKAKNIKKQIKVFKKLIALSQKLEIPMLIHSRKAEEETVQVLEELKPKKIVMHCFGGNLEQTQRAVELGCYFSIPTSIVRNKSFKKLVKRVPLDKLLTETDAPYLSPYEDKKRNEPSFIVETIKKIAEIKKITEEELEKIIFMNYQRLFS
jgi:TatD DNase family protein